MNHFRAHEHFEVRERKEYCLQCWALGDGIGCYGIGPAALSKEKAVELAEAQGWKVIGSQWACPAHVRAYVRAKESAK